MAAPFRGALLLPGKYTLLAWLATAFALFHTVSAIPVTTNSLHAESPVVTTEYGPVRGRVVKQVAVYHGVPFAAPPLGALRWKPPQPPQPWNETRQAVFPRAWCPQLDLVKHIRFGEEDCLYLSVYVPNGCSKDAPCPVMQWIYGGAWELGSNRDLGKVF